MIPDMEAEGNLFHGYLPVRYVFALAASMGIAIIYILRLNMSIMMLAMVDHSKVEGPMYYCCMEDGPLHWTRLQQSIILSSYYWGFIMLHINGKKLLENCSAKWVTFIAIVINIIAHICIPFATTISYGIVISARVIQGLCASLAVPAMHILLSKWSPQQELGIMSKLVYMGMSLGNLTSILCAGVLTHYLGWKLAYYVIGAIGIPWCIFWAWFIHDSPTEQKYINLKERIYIVNNRKEDRKDNAKIPWKSIFTCRPFYAILIVHFFNNWGWYLFIIEMPFYISSVSRVDILLNSVYSSIPLLLMWIFSLVYHCFIMCLLLTHRISIIHLRKLSTAIGGLVPAICLCVINYVDHDPSISILMLHIWITSLGTVFYGYMSNHTDIAPRFTETLISISNTVSQIPGIVVPFIVGYLTEIKSARNAWYLIFYITAGMYMIGVIFYMFLASAEVQKWDKMNRQSPGLQRDSSLYCVDSDKVTSIEISAQNLHS